MNFRQIDCFLAVAETLSFSAAAKRLFLSQSTVSAQVLSLEKELGFDLLDRDRHHVRLTRAGAYLAEQWGKSAEAFDRTVAHARSLADDRRSTLVLGYDGPIAERRVGAATALFHRQMPDVELKLRKKPMGELTLMLESGELDAAVTVQTEVAGAAFGFRPLGEGGSCVFVGSRHRLAEKPLVTPADLAGETVLSPYAPTDGRALRGTAAVLTGHGVDLGRAQFTEDGDTAFMMVQAGLGVFVASHLCDEFARNYDVVAVDLDAGLQPAVSGLAWKVETPAVRTLVRCFEHALGAERAKGVGRDDDPRG